MNAAKRVNDPLHSAQVPDDWKKWQMGYELWTSPVTGYRRHGTRLSDFNEVLGGRTLASDICEPLKCCAAGAPADEMRTELERLDFTVAGVREIEGGPVIGFVESADLTHGEVRNHLHGLSEVTIIPRGSDITTLLAILKYAPFVFVEGEFGVDAILTLADINKPMVRVYVFGLISLLEMHLSFWVAHNYADGEWQQALSEARLEFAEEVRRKRAALGQDLLLIQCLQICDKRTLVSRSIEIRDQLGLGSKTSCERFLRKVEALRDTLAHSQYDLAPNDDWNELLLLVEAIKSVIFRSDGRVENKALDSAAGFKGLLW